MIVTVTLNPCIDKTIYLHQLSIGAYNRVKSTRSDLSGKGINVSTVLSRLQAQTRCMGLNFRGNAQMLEQVLNRRGLSQDFVLTDGEIRTNVKLFDESCQVMTEINEAGPTVSARAVDILLDKIEAILDETYLLVLSGSIPPGVPVDIYRRIIRMAHRKDVKTVLDASGEPFLLALEEKPYLIKPNAFEFEQAFQKEIRAGKSPLEVAKNVVDSGISYICISMGSDGALLVDKEHAYRAAPPSGGGQGSDRRRRFHGSWYVLRHPPQTGTGGHAPLCYGRSRRICPPGGDPSHLQRGSGGAAAPSGNHHFINSQLWLLL